MLTITPAAYIIDLTKYDFIDTTLNIIQFPKSAAAFETFYNKMDTLVFENRGQVRILHIGGSHLQADVISGRIREHFIKEYPGASAGRGFVFPYSAARTNTPSSYASYYKGIWDMNKNVQREIKKPLGLLGIAVSTSDPRAEITLMLDRFNSEPMWGETKFRLFGYSDNGDVVPVLRVDSTDIYGSPRHRKPELRVHKPPPHRHAPFCLPLVRRNPPGKGRAVPRRFACTRFHLPQALGFAEKARMATADKLPEPVETTAKIPNNVAIPQPDVARDSMFQGECDVLDTACLAREEAKNKAAANGSRSCANMAKKPAVNYAEGELDSTNIAEEHCIADTVAVPDSVKQNARPRFTLTGILTETDAPGIVYTNVGINGAKVHDYFEEVCPLFEKELAFYKPDLVIFAIGINDANVQRFNDKQFREDYDRLIARIKNVNPNVAFIFETNNDMFRKVRKRRYVQHPNGDIARKAFFAARRKAQGRRLGQVQHHGWPRFHGQVGKGKPREKGQDSLQHGGLPPARRHVLQGAHRRLPGTHREPPCPRTDSEEGGGKNRKRRSHATSLTTTGMTKNKRLSKQCLTI